MLDGKLTGGQVAWWRNYALEGVGRGEAAAAVRRYEAALGVLEARLAGAAEATAAGPRPFLCGDHLTVADVAWCGHQGACNSSPLPNPPPRPAPANS